MLRRTKKGLIIWGGIMIFFALYAVIVYAFAGNGWQARSLETKISAAVIVLLFLSGGTTMLTFGIINAVLTGKHNRELLSRNLMFTANCVYCGSLINCDVKAFRPHRNFKEGYTVCPYCKKPVSKNIFGVYENQPAQQPR